MLQTLNFYPNTQKHWVPLLVPLMAGFTFLEGASLLPELYTQESQPLEGSQSLPLLDRMYVTALMSGLYSALAQSPQ